jgi:hypothetical protein
MKRRSLPAGSVSTPKIKIAPQSQRRLREPFRIPVTPPWPTPPELTRNADIKLNERLSLHRHRTALSCAQSGTPLGHPFVDLTTADINVGHFKLPNSKRTLSATKRREDSARPEALPADVSGSLDIEQKSPTQPASRVQRIRALWPWAFLIVAGSITLAWAIGLGWGAFALVRWIVG